jgi:DNA-binding MarR family transcriptional regulator
MTEWLSDEEQQAWRGLLHMTNHLRAGMARQLQGECGISLPEFEVLAILSEAPESGLRVRDLQTILAWEQSRISHQLTRMQRRDLVQRSDCPADRRGTAYTLTAAGRKAIEAAAPGHVTAVRRLLFDHLTADDVADLTAITTRVNSRLRQAEAAPATGT